MSGVPKIEVTESAETLRELMKKQKSGLGYAKVQSLYLWKTGVAETVRYIAVIVGREESTVHRWFALYRTGGMDALLDENRQPGRPKKVGVETVAKLQQELRDPEGFSSYKEIHLWCLTIEGIQASYATIYRVVRYELQAKLKVVRPRHERQQLGAVEEWVRHLVERLKMLKELVFQVYGDKEIRYWCQDETRLGLKTIERRRITLKGIKPEGVCQNRFDYYYTYGLIEPMSGESFFYEFSHVNHTCFKMFIEEFSRQFPQEIHIIQLDNAAFHTTRKLILPENIIFFFQPPYCPEVNPMERFWQFLKDALGGKFFDSLQELKEKVGNFLTSVSAEVIQSLTGWDYILQAISLAGF
jgi:transposase